MLQAAFSKARDPRRRSNALLAGLAVGLLLLSGCKADLYSNLSEVEANQMMAALMSSGIQAEKSGLGETFTLRVDEADMVQAISILNAKGYPRNQRDSIGSVFQKSGIISSPFEERVRYIYALGEDVAQTLSEIDGVVSARVHVVLPAEPQLGQPVTPSSAAVFIKHEPNVDLEYFVPQIRRLVSSSIEGLSYEAVTVVLTEAAATDLPPPAAERTVNVLPGLAVREADVGFFWSLAGGVAVLLALLLAGTVVGIVSVLSRRRARRAGRAVVVAGDAPNALMEPS
ncbi:type III secretion system inner membrane ring lipoprotein SctJ [Antarcticirhabdus aurantiaca]|uniref:Type III secretion inner membrane ring lipoprotein SctJ n=1 Tax=Antarcticirhabdus aurantiaca TaxID=2606717 RepID=A0ACD4NUK1_9HYPH|nr:type III secretion inner membrane ring lipoprotein SctJ [Antarcticirhabdus aurantiaca]WAJ30516.1 type III secretion inner membrane ring lipoprotein SctJ [Jeongeuplla avenae]